ncbi:MAG: GHKL domain-containing protein [Firmicutes bacterium]|nr:GHKL domain-containing protein [Bacillota bacterium]
METGFMKKLKKMFLVAFLVAMGSLFYLNFLVDGFIITLAVIMLPILLYKYKSINPISTCSIVAIISPGFRGAIKNIYYKNTLIKSFYIIAPDIFFYATYGFIFYYMYSIKKSKDFKSFFNAVFLSDFISNLVEIGVRTKISGIEINIIKWLLVIAFVRSLIVITCIIIIERYKAFLEKQEHEIRYRQLMNITSKFKSEIYFISKNMTQIEKIMSKSFKAHKLAIKENTSKELKNITIDISKDIHEIKKDYIRVIKGLEEIPIERYDTSKIELKDLTKILEANTREYINNNNLDIDFKIDVNFNMYIKDHYYLMSVLRNLVNNSIEACKMDNSKIVLEIKQAKTQVIFSIIDNGIGIEKSDIEYVFNPGFSTKFDMKTGNISRGLGLTLVKGIVEDHFKGKINIQSERKKGTTFKINISKSHLEGNYA